MSSVNSKSQTEHIKQLISGLASMNISQEKLKEELRKAKFEKEAERKKIRKLIHKVRQSHGNDSSDEDDGQHQTELIHRIFAIG